MSSCHPLATFLATEAEPAPTANLPAAYPEYDPVTQLQGDWNDVTSHLDILCSDANTGEPSTKTQTTTFGANDEKPDLDTDDSGT